MQYHQQQRLRWSNKGLDKGLDVAWRSRDLLRDGTFYRRWCPLVLALAPGDLDEFHSRLEYELQREGVRDRFVNVRMASPTTDKKSLRDVIAHYRTARLNSFQMGVRRDGSVPNDTILEPGAWAHEYSGAPALFGEGNGIARVCRELTSGLAELTEPILVLLREQNPANMDGRRA